VRRFFGGILLAGVLCAPLGARAQGRDPAGAEVLYRAGRDAAKKGDWVTACAKLAESQRLDPAPGTLLNLADCEEHRGQLATAWQHFLQAQGMMPKNDARVAFTQKRANALEKRVPRLVVRLAQGAPPATRVVRDDQELLAASLGMALPVDPGDHVIVTTLDGHAEGRTYVTLGEGETRDVTVAAGAANAPPAPAPTTPQVAPTPAPAPAPPSSEAHYATIERTTDRRPVLGWLGVGLGAVALGTGAVTGVLALQRASTVKDRCGPQYATCDNDAVDAAQQGKTFTLLSTVGFAAGAALTAAGLYFLLTPAPGKSGVALRLGPRGGSVEGSF
jgi:hypothetical protein